MKSLKEAMHVSKISFEPKSTKIEDDLFLNMSLSSTPVKAPSIYNAQEKYRVDIGIYCEFYSSDKELKSATDNAINEILEKIYKEFNDAFYELEKAIYGRNFDKAMKLLNHIKTEMRN